MPADGVRRVQLPIAALAAVALFALPFVRHARNRLLSGQPIGFVPALAQAGTGPGIALGLAALLLLAPCIRPGSDRVRWTGLLGAGLALGAAGWMAAAVASDLGAASASPSARTSLGAGAWVLLGAIVLLASDTARRLRLTPVRGMVAALLVFSPLALLLWWGELGALSLLREYAAQRGAFAAALQRHLLLVFGAMIPAVLLGIPLGVGAQRRAALRRVAFPVLNLIQTIPSIALFGLLIGPLAAVGTVIPGITGVGLAPALIALVLYALLPIVRNTVEGLDGVPRHVRDAARGMGMTATQAFWHVEAPLAFPVLLSGLRVTVVQTVGLAAVSALIGAGGLGAIIFQGLFANALDLVLLGALPVIALAVAADLLFRALASWTGPVTGRAQ
jgi:osmoprotectant transport system permease protein